MAKKKRKIENKMILKVFEMDYDFIIKNYLDVKLWSKEWTLFEYKNFKITLMLDEIYTRREEIEFVITVHYRDINNTLGDSRSCGYVKYSLKIDDIEFLKRKIETKIFELIQDIERAYFIKQTNEYYRLKQLEREEFDRLEEIATEFLNSNNVQNENIKDAYIDAYVSEYSKIPEKIDSYIEGMKYQIITDFYLIWLRSLDVKYAQTRIKEIEEKITQEELEEILTDIKEYEEYMETEAFEEEMQGNLEEI